MYQLTFEDVLEVAVIYYNSFFPFCEAFPVFLFLGTSSGCTFTPTTYFSCISFAASSLFLLCCCSCLGQRLVQQESPLNLQSGAVCAPNLGKICLNLRRLKSSKVQINGGVSGPPSIRLVTPVDWPLTADHVVYRQEPWTVWCLVYCAVASWAAPNAETQMIS